MWRGTEPATGTDCVELVKLMMAGWGPGKETKVTADQTVMISCSLAASSLSISAMKRSVVFWMSS